MTIILCIDERLGLSFGNKRQSRDKALTKDILNLAKGRRIIINEYSALLFKEADIDLEDNNIIISGDPVKIAENEDLIFLEISANEETLLKADELILYSWNRHYPSTIRLDKSFLDTNFDLYETVEFPGNSHEKLTRYATKRK